MKQIRCKKEQGFLTVSALLILVLLSASAVGTYYLMRNEGRNMGNHVNAERAKYAAQGATYYAIQRFAVSTFEESESLTLGDATVTFDTTMIDGGKILLSVTATVGNMEKTMEVTIDGSSDPVSWLERYVVWNTGAYYGDWVGCDSIGTPDPSRVMCEADSMPSIDLDALKALAYAQGHVYVNLHHNFLFDGFPNGSFYYSGDTPNVIYVKKDFQVTEKLGFHKTGGTVYGIFIVEGAVSLEDKGYVHGVIYHLNPDEYFELKDDVVDHLVGGIVGTSKKVKKDGTVRHWPEYMRAFCKFLKYEGNANHDFTFEW